MRQQMQLTSIVLAAWDCTYEIMRQQMQLTSIVLAAWALNGLITAPPSTTLFLTAPMPCTTQQVFAFTI
jgi:hypothetical protein